MLVRKRSFVFNPKKEVFRRDPYPIFRIMREHYPLYKVSNTTVVTRYDHVKQCLREPALKTSGIPVELAEKYLINEVELSRELMQLVFDILLFEESANHRPHRRNLMIPFKGKWFEALKTLIDGEVGKIAVSKGLKYVDIAEAVSHGIWVDLFLQWLRLPNSARQLLIDESRNIRLMLDPGTIRLPELLELAKSLKLLRELFAKNYYQNRGSDNPALFFSALLSADGDYEVDDYVIDAITVFLGGSETTGSLIGNAVLQFALFPEQQERLRCDRSLLQNAIAEVMRIESPLQMTKRAVEESFEIEGTRLGAGTNVLLCLGAANRDDRVFEQPDAFDVARGNAVRNLGFGFGRHQCLGQMLAQTIAEAVCAGLLNHFPAISLSADLPLVWQRQSLILRAPERLVVNTGL